MDTAGQGRKKDKNQNKDRRKRKNNHLRGGFTKTKKNHQARAFKK